MTHFVGLVIGPDIAGQLARYDENLEVARHRAYEAPPSQAPDGRWNFPYGTALALEPGLDVHDLTAVAKVMNDGEEVWGVDDGGLYYSGTHNPDAKWDWWRIGGRWGSGGGWDSDDHGYLILADGTDAVQAPASQIDWDRTVLERGYVPGVLVAEGVWRERASVGWFGSTYNEQMSEADWGIFVTGMIRGAGTLDVTVVDFHI